MYQLTLLALQLSYRPWYSEQRPRCVRERRHRVVGPEHDSRVASRRSWRTSPVQRLRSFFRNNRNTRRPAVLELEFSIFAKQVVFGAVSFLTFVGDYNTPFYVAYGGTKRTLSWLYFFVPVDVR